MSIACFASSDLFHFNMQNGSFGN